MAISLRNRQRTVRVETRWLSDLGQRALAALECPTAEVSVLLVGDAAMARLNRTHRGVEGPTDVLAFPLREGPWSHLAPELLGDVVISVDTARRQGRQAGTGFRAELALLLVHGILHLLGYDHGGGAERRRMWRKQRAVLLACGVPAPRSMQAFREPRLARRPGQERER